MANTGNRSDILILWNIVIYYLKLAFDFINKYCQIIKVALVNDLYKSGDKN